MSDPAYDRGVFLNCPFDTTYRPLFHAIVFTVKGAGLEPRSALELDDAVENRLGKILRMIAECRYGIHDLSRTELNIASLLPRFNMPLELGLFLGCRVFGAGEQAQKCGLILDREPYRYQKFISDLAGHDVHAHAGHPRRAMAEVRSWLCTARPDLPIPGGAELWRRYTVFQRDLPAICAAIRVRAEELTFPEFVAAIGAWWEVQIFIPS
jgi:hypothetical protein